MSVLSVVVGLPAVLAVGVPASAQTSGACDNVSCETLPTSICDAGGFTVEQTGYTPASTTTNGTATYTYEICSPAAGFCTGDNLTSCLDNNKCTQGGNPPGGTCTRDCAVDQFRGLSHFDIFFPELGGLGSCLSAETTVTGSCACTAGSSSDCHVDGEVVTGDGSCFASGTPVAKCDNTTLLPGDCITMNLSIAGELNGLGLGSTVVVSKESTDCNESCLAGPSCEPCEERPPGGACLTRTIGFWGTHPWITNDYDPVTVCGVDLGCNGAAGPTSNPTCLAGQCDSIMEGLCSVGGEDKRGAAYIAMVRQLTAAKLNLNATGALFDGAACSDFVYQDQSIQEWIAYCEGLCTAGQSRISSSGCIEALDAFNNSEDTGFVVTPSPFDRPPVDDFGVVSGADPSGCSAAQGNGGDPVLVIGKEARPALRTQAVIDCRP